MHVINRFNGHDCYVNNGETDVSVGYPYYEEEDDDDLKRIIQSTNHISIFESHLKSVEALLQASIDEEAKFSLLVMIHGHVVAAVEGYLSSTFIHHVINSDDLMRKLVESDPVFAKMEFKIRDIYKQNDGLKRKVANYLKEIIFHDLSRVMQMYKSVFDFEFGDMKWLFLAISLRHHCVHRAGFDKEGKRVNITDESVLTLMRNCQDFVKQLEKRSDELRYLHDYPF